MHGGIKIPIENSKAHEIKRLTTPLTIKDSKAYDERGNLLNCTETLSDVRFILEPREGILSENEVLQYAPDSKAASKIRLERGIGDLSDVLLIKESLPWILAIYYVVLIPIGIIIGFGASKIFLLVILILFVLPLVYLYWTFNLNRYSKAKVKTVEKPKKTLNETEVKEAKVVKEDAGIDSLKDYGREINNLIVIFDVKERVVRDLIKRRFEPPQITYDKFISMIDSSNKLFNQQVNSAKSIIELAAEDTPRVRGEIEYKIANMKKIIDQIEELTNELVINISSDDESKEEVENLIENMENLIGSVKEY